MTNPWVESYVGMPWIAGEFECWHLVVHVLKDRFDITDLPLISVGTDLNAARRVLSDHPERARWRQIDAPVEGDVVLMRRGTVPCHVGLWVHPGLILHGIQGAGAILTHPDRLPDLGYRIAGIYRRVGP